MASNESKDKLLRNYYKRFMGLKCDGDRERLNTTDGIYLTQIIAIAAHEKGVDLEHALLLILIKKLYIEETNHEVEEAMTVCIESSPWLNSLVKEINANKTAEAKFINKVTDATISMNLDYVDVDSDEIDVSSAINFIGRMALNTQRIRGGWIDYGVSKNCNIVETISDNDVMSQILALLMYVFYDDYKENNLKHEITMCVMRHFCGETTVAQKELQGEGAKEKPSFKDIVSCLSTDYDLEGTNREYVEGITRDARFARSCGKFCTVRQAIEYNGFANWKDQTKNPAMQIEEIKELYAECKNIGELYLIYSLRHDNYDKIFERLVQSLLKEA